MLLLAIRFLIPESESVYVDTTQVSEKSTILSGDWYHGHRCISYKLHFRIHYTYCLHGTITRNIRACHSLKGVACSKPHQLPIGLQPPESRWSKRAGLHVLHCGRPPALPPFMRSVNPLAFAPAVKVLLEDADRLAHGRLDV